ncbi:hypothetical protein SVAN01_03458 [Stagonosporopsis vannaccii]|nr:hypothetical protein SVAN01_03458 [Stagonosporopsis vannaccii]
MFIPRAVRLKGVKEPQRPKAVKLPQGSEPSKYEANSKDALVQAMGETSMNSPAAPQDTALDVAVPPRGPRFTIKPITPEYIAQLAAGVQLIFTDYALQEEKRSRWLRDHYRAIDGEENYIHLTAILEHPNISKMKPEATQILLKQALREDSSNFLELSHNQYYVRRRQSTNPLPFVPSNSFEIVNDDGLSFWDQRTIYVEPHLRNICPTPARVAQWLAEHGQLKQKWLPIQAVHTLWNSCAFVVLSGSVMHEGTWNKWRGAAKPQDWKIMTKVEHTKRTAEYMALLEKENPRGMRRVSEDASHLPPIARPAALPMDFDPFPEISPIKAGEKKKNRKRRKPAKSSNVVETVPAHAEDDVVQNVAQRPSSDMVDVPQEVHPNTAGPTNKKKRKRRKGVPSSNFDDATTDAAKIPNDEPEQKKRR